MIGEEQKLRDLEQLKRFILNPDIGGYISHVWYSSLRTKYPYEYIRLMKIYRNTNKSAEAVNEDERRISAAIGGINQLYEGLKKYFINPPKTDEEKKDFEKKTGFLEGLILKQALEN